MVSLDQRQNLATLSESNPDLKRFGFLLSGNQSATTTEFTGEIRHDILSAILSNSKQKFIDSANKISNRKISADSDWCYDDYLVFLLILGNQKFDCDLAFIEGILEIRKLDQNPLPRKINEVFSALYRKDFSVSGPLCFLKVPFLHLTNQLELDSRATLKTLESLSEPGLVSGLSPFFNMLLVKAHDLAIASQRMVSTTTFDQLAAGLELHAKNLSLRQWLKLASALPVKAFIWIGGLALAWIFSPILIGIGNKVIERDFGRSETPSQLIIEDAANPDSILLARIPSGFLALIGVDSAIPIHVTTHPLDNATPEFVLEVSHSKYPILEVLTYLKRDLLNDSTYTILPSIDQAGRKRVYIPRLFAGEKVAMILMVQTVEKNILNIAKDFDLRPLPGHRKK